MSTTTLPETIIGQRHERFDGRECFCGCRSVAGHEGRVLRNSDTPKLLTLDPPMLVAEFAYRCPAGGSHEMSVAYSLAELAL